MNTSSTQGFNADAIQISGIEYRHPAELKPWPDNPRVHPEKQLTVLAASMRQFGFTSPILIDENSVILSGHGRVMAAIRIGIESVPTRVISGLKQSQKRAYVIADNKLAQLSSWEIPLLKSEMEVLIKDDYEIELTGFSTAEVDIMFDAPASIKKENPDDLQAVDMSPVVVTRVGDLWSLGDHYLLCADSLNPQSFQQVMQGVLAQMVMTDPPFNVAITGHVCGNGKVQHKEFAMASGEMSPTEFTEFLRSMCMNICNFSRDGAVIYICMDWRHIRELQDAALPHFGPPRQLCVWVKDNGGMGTFYRSQHELVFVFRNGQAPHINNFELGQHGRYRTNVWNYPGANSFKGKGHDL